MRRKAVDYADDIVAIAKYKARHEGFTNVEQHGMHVNISFFTCKGFHHVRQ